MFAAISNEVRSINTGPHVIHMPRQNKVVLREEDPEQTIVRMLGFLRVLKYRPPTGDLYGNSNQK